MVSGQEVGPAEPLSGVHVFEDPQDGCHGGRWLEVCKVPDLTRSYHSPLMSLIDIHWLGFSSW